MARNPPLRLLYLTNSRLPGEKAHAIQIMHTCAALAALVQVRLVHARRVNRAWLRGTTDLRTHYALPRDVARHALPSLDLMPMVNWLPIGRAGGYALAFAVQNATYHIALLLWLLFSSADVYYTRDSLSAAVCLVLGRRRVYFEAHTFPTSAAGLRLQRWLSKRLNGLAVLTPALRQRYIALGCAPQNVHVIPDAVDLQLFAPRAQAAARARTALPAAEFIALYAGQMYAWKGVETLVAAAQLLPAGCCVVLVGGTPEDLPRLQALAHSADPQRLRFVGHVAPTEVPHYLAAADVLVLPNSGHAEISRNHTSPLKMFEYMAAQRAIVASDLPALRTVLVPEENALLVPPDDAPALAAAILRLQADAPLRQRLSAAAAIAVTRHTWDNRARSILKLVAGDAA